MAKYKIEFFKDKCIGCGACTSVCPDNWELKGDKSHPKSLVSPLACNKEAEDICPAQAIKVTEVK